MPNAIYSGEGEYDGDSLLAVYNAYLPTPVDSVYEFKTGTVYNMSCEDYPNRILLFMRVKNAPNYDLSTTTNDGNTNDAPTVVMFSLQKKFIVNINPACIPLDTTKDIDVILFHDQYYDNQYVSDNLFCKAPALYSVAPEQEEGEGELESPAVIIPKVGGKGRLTIKFSKP